MDALKKLYWLLRYDYKVHYLLPLLLLVPIFIFLWRDPLDTYVEPGEPVIAQITQLSVGHSRLQGRTPGLVLAASTADGISGVKIVLPSEVAGCKAGDPIRAERKGIKLHLQPSPCEN
ncbi:hypothetical protein VRS74_11950 [Erythrobacteraceae bacterium 1XM1-14]|uniref:Uncharacterized protein n=1 Tax=Altererythrobacter litoralis TaxID=3113904 RepID=A0ABU7GHV0_9SPHN|nr:hypothetical protein [Erythrobacteraceae bacterium 1XM1-14]